MDRLEKIVSENEQDAGPPVHLWNPESSGKIDIKIDADGHWWHEGERIGRAALVQLFASILWYEDGGYFLVTPAEKLQIEVEDVPYIIQAVELIDDNWVATTTTLETVIVSHDNPVELRRYGQRAHWVPYLRVRYDLWARLDRGPYYDWVTTAVETEEDRPRGHEVSSDNIRSQTAGLFLMSGDYRFEVARE